MNFARIASTLALFAPTAWAADKTNIVMILADDLGYADLGCYGGKDIPTPNIDSLARDGVRCTDAYVSCPYCSPTRAGLLTGRYQQRFGHEFNEGRNSEGEAREVFGLPLEEKTMGDHFKALGYTTIVVGKWHLGSHERFRPMRRGFDEFYGTLGNTPFLNPQLVDSRRGPDPAKVEDGDFHTTAAYGIRARDFIEAHKGDPFLLYLPMNACHVPIQPRAESLKKFESIADEKRRGYAAILSELDDAVGMVLSALRDANLEESTLVVFLVDNGGPMTKMGQNGSNNRPLKGQKGDVYEGGVRVPLLARLKGKIPPNTTYDKPVIALDLLPTALAAAGAPADPMLKLDGVNLLGQFTGQSEEAPHERLYWRFGPQWAVREGDWKLTQGYDYATEGQVGRPQEVKVVAKPQLFNLKEDSGETTDLAAMHPEKVEAMRAAYEAWNAEMMPPRWLPPPPANPPAGDAATKKAERKKANAAKKAEAAKKVDDPAVKKGPSL